MSKFKESKTDYINDTYFLIERSQKKISQRLGKKDQKPIKENRNTTTKIENLGTVDLMSLEHART